MPAITTFLTFNDQADAAVRHYLAVFEHGRILSSMPGPNGTVMSLTFELFGKTFIAMNGGPSFAFGNGISLFVECETQAEIDRFYDKLAEGGQEVQCGWLTDKFGVTWQIIPKDLPSILSKPKALQAMLRMKKLDIAALKKAAAD